jgi:hypothetical protein
VGRELYLRETGQLDPRTLAGSEDGEEPSFRRTFFTSTRR